MRGRTLLVLLAATAMVPGVALAQDIQGGAARGAAAGSHVLGPVGAAVGAAVGGTVGIFEPPPPPVVTYVQGVDVPSVTVQKDVVVGEALPPTVIIHPIPHREHYAYAVVNNERLIVEPQSRKVIEVVPAH
jgi:Protein of unknown function (DUF1236)